MLKPLSVISSYERRFRPFTEPEAWLLFRLAAFGEALGWTILITGILLKRFTFHGNNLPVLIAGQIHGTLFIIYMVVAIITFPSLGWSRLKALVAIAASVPPYGSLVLEKVEAWKRRKLQSIVTRNLYFYLALIQTQ